jgi:hypothetical protein
MGNPGQDEFEMSHIAWACVAAIACMCVASAEPALVFSKDELAEFRERVETGENARVWAEVLARAEALCDPDSQGVTGSVPWIWHGEAPVTGNWRSNPP